MDWRGWKGISIASSALLLVLCGIIIVYWKGSTTVVLVVRHAERVDSTTPAPTPTPCTASASCALPTSGSTANPPLSSVGETRRDELAHVVEDAGIQAIYASCFCRTQQTVATAATNLSLTTNLVSQHAADGTADVTDLVQRINTDNVGQKILVAGHQSTVKKLIEDLGGGTIDDITDNEFDNLYVVTIYRGWWRFGWFGKRVRVVRLKYGAAT
jgi:broad specificity phosphatase PhoE